MSDSSNENNREDPVVRAAQIDKDSELKASQTAAGQRQQDEIAGDAAVSRAAHRDVAELVARNEAYNRHMLETAQKNAKIAAEKAKFPFGESSMLHEELAAERKTPSSVTFGLAIVSLLVLIGLIAGGLWYFSAHNSANSTAVGITSGVTPGIISSPSGAIVSE